MSELSKQALKVDNNTSFPNNNAGAITPSDLRDFNVNMIDSLVDEIGYNVDSASWNTSISNLNTFTSSQQPAFNSLNAFTASQLQINSGVNTFTQSADGRLNNLEAYTASFTTSVGIYDEGTFVQNVNEIDFNGNGITASFVSGKASVTVDFSKLNSATASLQAQLATIGGQSGSWITESETGSFVSSAITASSLITASFNNGTRNLTFTKGDNTTFNVNIPDVSGSALDTGSLVTTASFNAYTASTNQRVSSLESTSASLLVETSNLETFSASALISISNLNTATASLFTSASLALVTASLSGNTITFTKGDASTFGFTIPDVSGSTINTASFATTGSNVFNGDQTISGTINLPNGGTIKGLAGGTTEIYSPNTAIAIISKTNTDISASGALALYGTPITLNGVSVNPNTYATTGSNSFTGIQTLFDAGGNSTSLVEASGSLMLVAKSYTSASAHISASSNAFVNLIFKNSSTTADTIVSGSNNIFPNASAPTTGFKRYVGGNGNYYNGTTFPQISGSMAFPVSMNRNVGNFALNIKGPVSSSAYTINDNCVFGGVSLGTGATTSFEKMVSGYTFSNNGIFGGTINIVAAKTQLDTAPTMTSNLIFGAVVSINHNSSSLTYNSNIQNGGITIDNNYISASGASTAAAKGVSANVNTVYGVNHSLVLAGSNTSNTTIRTWFANFIAGANLTSSLQGSGDNSSMVAVGLLGNGLIVSGTSASPTAIPVTTADATYGSYFSGRFNAVDGNKAKTAETVFAVGTGTSYSNRKTGFLIDSGSNTYVEGTLNVSGSLFVNGNKQLNVGAFSSNITQSGSANVSQSMNFETTDISSGVSIASNSRITLANSGTYNIQFSAQIDRVSGIGTDTVHIWLKKNGTNVSASAGAVTISGAAAAAKTIAAWNYVVDAAANDYYELVWEPTDANIQLINQAAGGNIPSTPSIILTVTQVR